MWFGCCTMYIYSNKKETTVFHGPVSFDEDNDTKITSFVSKNPDTPILVMV